MHEHNSEPENSGCLHAKSHPDGRGIFVSFEGAECSGKSTQADLLVSWLQAHGFSVLHTREPGGTDVGEAIRDMLLASPFGMAPSTEALLFAAARAEHADKVIQPALERGQVVICDRYIDSSVAYQGYGLGLCPEEVLRINRWALQIATPDLTILLGSGRELHSAGQMEGLDRIESRDEAFHRRVRYGYAALLQRHSERIIAVDTARGIEATADEIRRIFRLRFGPEEK